MKALGLLLGLLTFAGAADATPAAIVAAALSTAVAAGVSYAVGTWVAFSFAQSFAVNLALSAFSGLLNKPKQQNQQPDYSANARDRLVVVRSAVETRRVIYGQVMTSGPLVYAESARDDGGGSAFSVLHLVIALAGHEVEEIGDIYFDDELVPFASSGEGIKDAVSSGRFAGYAYVARHLGGASQTADATLVAGSAGIWTANHRLRGVAYLYFKLVWNADVYTSGIPNIKAVVKGKKLYDPRTGLTAWSSNWALCVRDYLASDYGLGCASAEIDDTVLIATANICDEYVDTVAGSPSVPQRRYDCNGTIDTGDKPLDIMNGLLTAAAGACIYTQGVYKVYAGAYRTPTVSLDESDLRGELQVQPRRPRRELYNGVRGTFADPDKGWQPTDFPAVTNSTYEADDGGVQILRDIQLPYTTDPIRAQRIAKIHLEKSRQGITVSMPCKYTAFKIAVWDTVYLSIDQLGWASKVFLVTGWKFAAGGGIDLELQEEAAAVYDWNYGDATTVDAARDTSLPTPWSVATPGTLTVTETLYQTTGSAGVKSRAVVSWSALADAYVASGGQYQVEVSPHSAGTYRTVGLVQASILSINVDDLAPGFYDFRQKAINALGVSSSYSPVATVELYGLNAPPTNLASFAVQAYSGQAKFTWAKPSSSTDLDVVIGGRIYVRWSPLTTGATWEHGSLVNPDGYPGDTSIGFGPLMTGTYMAKACDSSGNYSATEASFVVTEALITGLTTIATVTESSTFTGTKSNVVLIDGGLQLDGGTLIDSVVTLMDDWGSIDALGGVSATGSYTFASTLDLGSVMASRLFATIGSLAFDADDLIDSRTDPIDDWGPMDGAVVEDAEVQLMVRATNDDPAGSPTWGSWHALGLVADYQARAFQFRLDFATGNATHNRTVTSLSVTAKH